MINARHLLAAPLVAAALASPYLTTKEQPQATSAAPTDPAAAIAPPVAEGGLAAEAPHLALPPNPTPPATLRAGLAPLDAGQARFAGVPIEDFSEILRFDITPEWIFTRWSRVSTITADQSLKGFRVALVTGTHVDDIAGVATYYFGRHGTLQRIAIDGRTGDPRRLIAFLSKHYGFKSEPNLGAGMYLVRWNAKPMSGLRIDYAPIVRADAPHQRYALKLEINRPDETYHMSDGFLALLGQDQQTKRWLPH